MSVAALKKAAESSKVLIYLVFEIAITIARWQGWVDQGWWETTTANAFYMTMGGYSVVEVGKAIMSGKTTPAAVLADPKAAMVAAERGPGDIQELEEKK